MNDCEQKKRIHHAKVTPVEIENYFKYIWWEENCFRFWNVKPDTEMSWYWESLRKKPLHIWGTDALLPCIFWQTHSGLLLQACAECFQVSKD